MTTSVTRRRLLVGTAGLAGAALLGGCARDGRPAPVAVSSGAVRRAEARRRARGSGAVVTAALSSRPIMLDLGGRTVSTWGYADQAPGPLIRARAGDLLRVSVDNQLPIDTSVHWHGVALRNDMDGVPGLTQQPIRTGERFTYEFTAPDPGTYWYHPHVGTQLDRALYGVLLVDDPDDPGRHDVEWTIVLDDWVDGTGRTPEQVLARLGGGMGHDMGGDGMGGMDHGDMGGDMPMGRMDHGGMGGDMPMGGMGMGGEAMVSPLLGGAGDVRYPHYLANGRVPTAPDVLRARPGQRMRLRIVNAGADTAFRVALGGHRMTVTHTDGFPVVPVEASSLLVGMGERYDVVVTLADGVFPLVAVAEGKNGQALALVRTGTGSAPSATVRPRELAGSPVTVQALRADSDVTLQRRQVDRTHPLVLDGGMMPYRWTINGRTYDKNRPLFVEQGERVRLALVNRTRMFHPMHVHGHTFQVGQAGPRKDTVIVRPRERLDVLLDADNPGQWMTHCHNIYHAETGMMINLAYQA